MEHGRAANSVTKLDEPADRSVVDLTTLRYAEELRAVGHALEAKKFISVELEAEADGYRVRAEVDPSKKASSLGAIVKQFLLNFASLLQTEKPPPARAIELRYGAEEIQKLIQEGLARRLDTHAVPDPYGLSNILRQTGAYLDSLDHATLVSVVVKGRWITIRYKNGSGQIKEVKQDVQFFYGYWVKMYLRRSDRSAPMLSKTHLP
jgi:hypothetical protein